MMIIWKHLKWVVSGLIVLISVLTLRFYTSTVNSNDNFVNVCDWYGMIDPSIIKQFEDETGIKVQYDLFDNNEVLEAKLLASNSGYDVVFPTALPYVMRQIPIGIYQPLNKTQLPNLKKLNHIIVDNMNDVDPNMTYVIPFYWGTLGVIIDEDKLKKLNIPVDVDSYDVLFNANNLKNLAQCGVGFLEESVDIFPLALLHLKENPLSESLEDLQLAYNQLKTLRPYIRKFSSARFMNDLIMGDLCVSQGWSGEAHQARDEVKKMNRSIRYFIPKEGSILWIDCIAIPAGAPHVKNAHAFINFLLRPDIAAKITNFTKIPTSVVEATPLVAREIATDPTIYPPLSVMKKMFMVKHNASQQGLELDRIRTKLWTAIRLNR